MQGRPAAVPFAVQAVEPCPEASPQLGAAQITQVKWIFNLKEMHGRAACAWQCSCIMHSGGMSTLANVAEQ